MSKMIKGIVGGIASRSQQQKTSPPPLPPPPLASQPKSSVRPTLDQRIKKGQPSFIENLKRAGGTRVEAPLSSKSISNTKNNRKKLDNPSNKKIRKRVSAALIAGLTEGGGLLSLKKTILGG